MHLKLTDGLKMVKSFSATMGQAVQCATQTQYIRFPAESGVEGLTY